jgi:hypothetical protein
MSPQHGSEQTRVQKGTTNASNGAYPLDHDWLSLRTRRLIRGDCPTSAGETEDKSSDDPMVTASDS